MLRSATVVELRDTMLVETKLTWEALGPAVPDSHRYSPTVPTFREPTNSWEWSRRDRALTATTPFRSLLGRASTTTAGKMVSPTAVARSHPIGRTTGRRPPWVGSRR